MLRSAGITFFVLMFAGASVAGCRSNDGPGADSGATGSAEAATVSDPAQVSATLAAGLERWRNSARHANQTYFYWRVKPGSESGVREVTGVQVRRGRVAARYLTRSRIHHTGSGSPEIIERSSETYDQAGRTAKANPAGFPPRTIEELYRRCDEVLPKSAQGPAARSLDFGLRVDSRGVLAACWVLERGCQGDCAANFGAAGLVFRELTAAEVEAFLETANPRFE
ncbi:MAG: hypothetical protein RIF32_04950 [Leptospirales bacterium]|jgi:hypothetical protein